MNILITLNSPEPRWDITAKVGQDGSHYWVLVYTNRGKTLHKQTEATNLREALIKACDIVGED